MTAYGLSMTTIRTVESKLSDNIESHLAAKRVTRKALFDRAGISRSTFERNMDDGSRFTVFQLMRIASALGIHVSDILPQELTHRAAD